MSDSDDSWDFKIDKNKAGSDLTKKTVAIPRVKKNNESLFEEDSKKIGVNENVTIRRKSRRELAKEYEREEDKYVEPHPDTLYGSFFRRFAAFGIDVFICSVLTIVGLTYFPSFFIENERVVSALTGLSFYHAEFYLLTSLLLFYFFLVIAPHIVFGASFGKKMMNVKVFGIDREKQGFFKGALRELFFKPVSLISLVGVLICFFSKKRKMLHDHLLRTEVHRE